MISGLALALCAVAPASAQLSQGKGPVDVVADSLEPNNTDCVYTWRGNVEAAQDNARLRTDLLKAYFQKGARSSDGGSCGDLQRMEAQGSVYYATPDQKVRGANAVYEAPTDNLTVTGDVVAVQGQNVLRGERMVINTKTGKGQIVGSATGANKPGRVRGVFYPNKSDKAQSDKAGAPAAGQRR